MRFGFRQYQTDGRLQNLYETLNEIAAGLVLLSFVDNGFDDNILDSETLSERLEVVRQSVRRLRKRKFIAELVLPSISDCADKEHAAYLLELYSKAAETSGCQVLWVDDAALTEIADKDPLARKLFYRQLASTVKTVNKKVSLGLLAAEPGIYARAGLNAIALAGEFSGAKKELLLAQSQPFASDYNRTELLQTALVLAHSQKLCYKQIEKTALLGNISQKYASPFHKGAESTRMQFNFNLLTGHRQVILNCFDEMGTAPRVDNLYLQMIKAGRKFTSKLSEYVPVNMRYEGVQIILADEPGDDGYDYSAAVMLNRMGLPVTVVMVSEIDDDFNTESVSLLCGHAPAQMTREQLDMVFMGGVLMDAIAAETIHNMGLPGLLGSKIGKPIEDVCTEILSFQGFANRYYGHQTMFRSRVPAGVFRHIEPFHCNAKVMTELTRHGKLANVDGMVIFDNIEHDHRSAILPFALNKETCDLLLSPARQVHTVEIIQWLGRNRICCFIENTPDLVPLFGVDPEPGNKRIVLTLTNVSFDWAIHARVRLGSLPFKVKKVRQINEQGRLIKDENLCLSNDGAYTYIHLGTDFAIAPMQMLVLVLE